MKLTFYWPNDNSTQDNEFIVSDYSYTQCYYNELLPADNYANVSIPWDTETANRLRLLKDDHIKVVITNDNNSPVFTGYIDSGIDFTKTQRLRPISLKLISPSFLLRQAVGETFAIKNTTVKNIIIQLLTRLNLLYNSFNIPNIIPIVIINEDEEYYEILEKLLFESGYVFDFDNNGKFIVLPIFDQPPAVTANIFDGGNIRTSVQEVCNKKKYDYIKTKFKTVNINSNDVVYLDEAEKEVPKGLYFGHESETGQAQIVDNGAVYCEYQSSKGELLWADVPPDNFTVRVSPSNTFIIEKGGSLTGEVETKLGNMGTSYSFRAKNNSQGKAKIKEIKAIGTSYTAISCIEISKSGSLLKEYDGRFLQNKSDAAAFTKNLANYYRYSSIKLNLESYSDYSYGSFVTVRENGIGEITARIVRKIYKLNEPISYELESVTDFTPANITGERTDGSNGSNISKQGPDIDPPSPPSNLVLSLREDGKVIGTFTKSPDDDINYYSVYRKTPDMPYKTVLTLDFTVSEFVDESTINGMSYTYKVVTADNSGNISNPSNEAAIGTVTIEWPDPPISASANAYEDYINITIVPPELGQDNRDIYTPSEYKIQISKNSGTTYSDVAITANTNYDYYFNRTIDGFPEINVLNKYRFRIYSVNSYGNLSIPITIPVSTGDYQTWIPVVPVNFRGSVTGRTCFLEWDRQNNIFGNIAYRIQISKDSVNWYKPNVSHDPYADEAYWKENNSEGDFLEITSNSFFQIVPLKGQNTVLENGNYKIEPETYYYRIKAVNTSSAVESNYTNDVILEAQGTSAQDILKNSVGWDQIIDKSILVEKLGVKKLIAGESTLAFIGNDVNVSDKTRQGFQYWALDDISINGTTFKKGEFRINSNTGDYFIVDPVNGIFFKASKIEMDALGSKVYGDFSIIDGKAANITQLFFDLIDNDGKVKTIPLITIGNNSKKPEINIYCTTMAINGKMNVVTPDLPWFA